MSNANKKQMATKNSNLLNPGISKRLQTKLQAYDSDSILKAGKIDNISVLKDKLYEMYMPSTVDGDIVYLM